MRLAFTKMHGLGNDFIVFDATAPERVPSPAALRALADRRTGIGFDQALVLAPPRTDGTDVYYRIFNADGSEVEQCGNGARCIARLVASRAGVRGRTLVLDSSGGLVNARLRGDGLVSVAMGIPNFDPRSLPFLADAEAGSYHIDLPSGPVEFGAVSVGNPHAVIRVRSVSDAPVDTVGPAMENHARFPRRVNVGFLEIVAPDHVRLRVFERGAGETRACGSGACAAVVAGILRGLLDSPVRVATRGGDLSIAWAGAGQPVMMTGPAVSVFQGEIELPDHDRNPT
jgi:diaminopimelate epimerase